MKDIIDQLMVLDNLGDDHLKVLCMPWNFTIKDLETDSELRAQLMVKESAEHVDAKLDAMEQRMMKKSQEMFSSLRTMIEGIPSFKTPAATYAGVTAPAQQTGHVWGPQVGVGGGDGHGQVQVRVTAAHANNSRG